MIAVINISRYEPNGDQSWVHCPKSLRDKKKSTDWHMDWDEAMTTAAREAFGDAYEWDYAEIMSATGVRLRGFHVRQ